MTEAGVTTFLHLKSPEVELAETVGRLTYMYTLFVQRAVDKVIQTSTDDNERWELSRLRQSIGEKKDQIQALGISIHMIAIALHHIELKLGYDEVKKLTLPPFKASTPTDTATKLSGFLAKMAELQNDIKNPSLHTPEYRFEMMKLQRLVAFDGKSILDGQMMSHKDYLHAITHLNAAIDYDITAPKS